MLFSPLHVLPPTYQSPLLLLVETIEQKNKLIELELGGFQGFVTEQINNVTEGQA
ncbi:hypothetical protein [Vibrio rumoiensis]|uniref:hypothetical protein n=1 Tax=Vibrio rumoiensis TaxID=76258 RepID=UPI0013A55C1B|nr:hypothetical protein [Vibrio rumoiensis]